MDSFSMIFNLLGFIENELNLQILKGNHSIMKSSIQALSHII